MRVAALACAHERAGRSRRGARPAARPERRGRAASAAGALHEAGHRRLPNVAIDLWRTTRVGAPRGAGTGGAVRWRRPVVAGTLIARTRFLSRADADALMKGDPRVASTPLPASAREVVGALPTRRSRCFGARLVRFVRTSERVRGRACTSGTARCPRRRGDPVLSAPYRPHDRTERPKARERKKKYDAVEIGPYTDGDIAAIEGSTRRGPRGPDPRWGRSVSRARDRPDVRGALTVTAMDLLDVGMGRVSTGSATLRLGWRNRVRIPRLSPRRLNIYDVMPAGPLGSEFAAGPATPPRSTTADAAKRAHPPVHGTGGATTPGCGSSIAVPAVSN